MGARNSHEGRPPAAGRGPACPACVARFGGAQNTAASAPASAAVRDYITSLPVDAEALLELVRGHWRGPSGRGNDLHCTLDVQFREDDCRLRRGHVPAVMGIR